MIESLKALPELTQSWLAPLQVEDPELYDELAEAVVVEPAEGGASALLPAGAHDVLAALDLRGKEVGAFHFAPAPGDTAAEQIANYDRSIRSAFDAGSNITFIGDYGQGSIFLSSEGVGLLDLSREEPSIKALASTFEGFLLAQANAYDAYKRYMVKVTDEPAYRAAAAACAASPAFLKVDVPAIFEAQLKN